MEQKKYNYFYRITNNLNGFYYYGIHSTNDLDDGYMGSGSRLKRAMQKYGKENFQKEILKFFDSREIASKYEEEVVNENCITDASCYNLKRGGDYGVCLGTILVKDKNGQFYRCKPNDEAYKNGTLIPFMQGLINVIVKGTKEKKTISIEEYHKNLDMYDTCSSGFITVKSNNGDTKRVPIDSEDYLSGNVVPIWKDRKHTEETKLKMSIAHKMNGKQKGSKNSQYGTVWINKNEENKKIKKEDITLYSQDGWIIGRKVNTDNVKRKTDSISIEIVKEYRNNGYTWQEIAKKLNIGKNTLTRFRKRNNLEG